MKKNTYLFLFLLLIHSNHINGQTGQKLVPGSTIQIIGTRLSVNYDNNQSSETVNAKGNVFDGDFNTFFASYDRSNTWVGLDLREKHVITQVAYCPRTDWAQRLTLGLFEGANLPDFGDAVPLYLIAEQPPANQLTEQAIANSRGFRYVRYVGPHDVRCNIAELEFYGYPDEGSDSLLTQITNIPDVIIHTVNAQDITDRTNYVKGIISFVSDDGTKIHTDSLDIRGRGNASWGFEKKPYRIKLYNKAKVLDNPAEARNWTLISNHGDKTLMRNLLAFDISRRLEMSYTPAGRPVNVFLNGEYKGCYQLCDHIDVRKHRVDVKEMKPSDVSGENLTGGYLVEIDDYAKDEALWFESQRNHIPVTIKSPDSDEIISPQENYIINHFNTWESSVFSSGYTHPETGFRKYTDTKSFVRHFLTGEFSGNTDTYWSVYMYKQRNDDKFYFGPVWDFDIAYDNDSRTYPVNNKTDWVYRSGGSAANGVKNLIDRMIADPELYKELRETYSYYRDYGIITEEKLLKVVDDYVLELDQSQVLNFKRWDIINKWVHMINHNTGSYQGEVNIVKNFISKRIAWMDAKLNYVPNPVSPITIRFNKPQSWSEVNIRAWIPEVNTVLPEAEGLGVAMTEEENNWYSYTFEPIVRNFSFELNDRGETQTTAIENVNESDCYGTNGEWGEENRWSISLIDCDTGLSVEPTTTVIPSEISEIIVETTENALLLTGITQPVHIRIANLTGQMVYEAQVSKDAKIPLHKGIYLLVVTDHLKQRRVYKNIVL